jgi:hypothetical protein
MDEYNYIIQLEGSYEVEQSVSLNPVQKAFEDDVAMDTTKGFTFKT